MLVQLPFSVRSASVQCSFSFRSVFAQFPLSLALALICFHLDSNDAMLEGVRITPGNRDIYTIFLDNGLIYSDWGRKLFFLSIGGLAKINYIFLSLHYLFISSLMPSNTLKRFALKLNTGVVNWAWSF